jgi:Trypsin-co-occurring domain 1
MSVLLQVPLDSGEALLVEADRADIPADGLTLAAPKPGEAVARAAHTLTESLEKLEPVLRAVREKLQEASPDHFAVEFGVKLGGETGVILAKGTAEVNLKITMTWDQSG